MDGIRIGQISNIDYANGMAKVLYNDRDGAVTRLIPIFSFNGEYKMPKVGQYVLVLHLSNGSEAGCVMGTYWNTSNNPEVSGAGVFRKELGAEPGEAFLQYNDGTLQINADKIVFTGAAGSISLETIISKLNQI